MHVYMKEPAKVKNGSLLYRNISPHISPATMDLMVTKGIELLDHTHPTH